MKLCKIFNNGTRDIDNLRVWRDEVSGVVFIDEYYTGDESYITGAYRDDNSILSQSGKENFEEENDAKEGLKLISNFLQVRKLLILVVEKGIFYV